MTHQSKDQMDECWRDVRAVPEAGQGLLLKHSLAHDDTVYISLGTWQDCGDPMRVFTATEPSAGGFRRDLGSKEAEVGNHECDSMRWCLAKVMAESAWGLRPTDGGAVILNACLSAYRLSFSRYITVVRMMLKLAGDVRVEDDPKAIRWCVKGWRPWSLHPWQRATTLPWIYITVHQYVLLICKNCMNFLFLPRVSIVAEN